MTEEEHKTRAMLLGKTYMRRTGWYSSVKFRQPTEQIHRVDAVTLEVITPEEHTRRVRISEKEITHTSWYPHYERKTYEGRIPNTRNASGYAL